jgi:alkanesulfonate monooxygenase SsuD/methylene tetrahydromethanopterin reductase-like flavin-dependent oxidoreductase (luciferase family)
MDFGILLTFSNPQYRIPVPRLVESQFAQSVLAEELGYDHVWTAGHHGTDMYFAAQFPVLAAVAARTHRIRLGTYIVALPLNSPLHLAEQGATLDVISGGRFDFGLGAGIFTHDFEAHGISRSERGPRMEEGLTIIKGLWENETFAFEGKHFKLPPFTLNPRPVQPRAPLWVAAATGTVAFDRAARFGCHLAGTSGGLDYYNERLRANGRDPKDYHRAVLHFTHVAETREQAWREAAPAILSWLEYYKKQFDSHDQLASLRKKPGGYFGVDPLPRPDDLENVQRLHFLGSPFAVGDPQDAAGWVDKALQSGVTHLVMSMQFGGMTPELSERSIRVFAKDVIPKYRRKT